MVVSPPGRLTRLGSVAAGATSLYVVALAMSGFAIVLSVYLPPDQRGAFVATTTSATVGVAVGGLSLETFVLAQGRAWLERTASWQSVAVYGSTVPLSAVLAWFFAVYTTSASPWLSTIGAAVLAAGTIPGAMGLAQGNFRGVYGYRALFAAAIPLSYGVLVLLSIRSSGAWMLCWLLGQTALAVVLWFRHGAVLVSALRRSYPFERRGVGRIAFTHGGGVALIPALRFDQLILARSAGPTELAFYSLAMAASEFAQAGSVVAAQRVLGDHGADSARRFKQALRASLIFAIAVSLLVFVGLYAIGLVVPSYAPALMLGLILAPRSLAVVTGKVLSARLVNQRGEAIAAAISAGTSVVAVITAAIIIPQYGVVGAAIAVGVAFVGHAFVTAVVLGLWIKTPRVSHRPIGEEVDELV